MKKVIMFIIVFLISVNCFAVDKNTKHHCDDNAKNAVFYAFLGGIAEDDFLRDEDKIRISMYYAICVCTEVPVVNNEIYNIDKMNSFLISKKAKKVLESCKFETEEFVKKYILTKY